jgi:hypothetical protein
VKRAGPYTQLTTDELRCINRLVNSYATAARERALLTSQLRPAIDARDYETFARVRKQVGILAHRCRALELAIRECKRVFLAKRSSSITKDIPATRSQQKESSHLLPHHAIRIFEHLKDGTQRTNSYAVCIALETASDAKRLNASELETHLPPLASS